MAYYLIFSFLFFIIVDYKYIYTFLDSKFIYSKTGSKLATEINPKKKISKPKYILQSYDLLDLYIFVVVFLLIFFTNFFISNTFFKVNPLLLNIGVMEINLSVIFEGYTSNLKIIYNLCCAICVLIFINKYRCKIRDIIIKIFFKNINTREENIEEETKKYLIAKDEYDECVEIEEETLYQNVLITGSIGTGKTSGAICRLTYNLIKSGKGGLVLDIKGNFVNKVDAMCKKLGRQHDLKVISIDSNYYFNILDNNINCLELANRLKQVITLLSPSNNSDAYWLDKVENVLMNILIIIKYSQLELNIMNVHRLVTEENFLKAAIAKIKKGVRNGNVKDKAAFEISSAILFIENEFFKIDTKVKSIIKSEITRLTIPLITDYEIYNQFCVKGDKQEITFSEDQIIILSINVGKNKMLAKIIATFLKLSYQSYILSNINPNTSSFFIADEYQEFCNEEDSNFLSLSRESKCINIISTQSYSSLKNALRNQSAADVIIQNLVNKIWFRNDDNYTVGQIVKQLGKIDVVKENRTISESGQESKKYLFREGFKNKKSSISKSLNYVQIKENEYDENFFSRELKTFEALAVINDKKEGMIVKKIFFERWKENE